MVQKTKLRYKLLLLAGLLAMADTLMVSVLVPKILNLEVLLPGVIGIIFTLYAIIKIKNPNIKFVKHKALRNFAVFIISFCIVFFVLVECIIIFGSEDQSNTPVDFVIVLGAGLDYRNKPSGPLLLRLDKCIEYVSQNPLTPIIVSGGQGPDEEVSEAFAMEEYLVSKGIPRDSIIMEQESKNTLENIKNSKALIDKLPDAQSKKVLIVTNSFHMFRAKMLAERFGLKAYGMPCITPIYTLPNNYLREFFAVIKSWIFDK